MLRFCCVYYLWFTQNVLVAMVGTMGFTDSSGSELAGTGGAKGVQDSGN